jgi:O-antigen ligase
MIPSWVLNSLLVMVGCIIACYVGSALPEWDYYGFYFVGLAVLIAIGMVLNDFPMLLAVGIWMPFELPIGQFRNFPPILLVAAWMSGVLFFRWCQNGTITYLRSFNLLFLICFAWVPIRFAMNPVQKFGASAGGSGVSGMTPYLFYGVAAFLIVFIGAILNNREKVFSYIRWTFLFVLFLGVAFLTCAFIPATAPYLYSWGVFAAGGMGDNIIRIVQLPAYGFFLVQAAFCPNLFRLRGWVPALLICLGLFMIVIGGNRSAVFSTIVAIPPILILRRRTHELVIWGAVAMAAIIALRFSVDQTSVNEISPLARSMGVFDSRIDKASGGDSAAEWRYAIWRNGWEKIMESPLTGKGFGNLPKYLDTEDLSQTTDFEVILAGGEAHNGFITAAYGFGLPFMIALTLGLTFRCSSAISSAWKTDKHDLELREYYALIVSMFFSFFVNIYTAFDLSVTGLWVYVAIGFILDRLPRGEAAQEQALGETGALPGYYGGQYGPYAYSGGPRGGPRRR